MVQQSKTPRLTQSRRFWRGWICYRRRLIGLAHRRRRLWTRIRRQRNGRRILIGIARIVRCRRWNFGFFYVHHYFPHKDA